MVSTTSPRDPPPGCGSMVVEGVPRHRRPYVASQVAHADTGAAAHAAAHAAAQARHRCFSGQRLLLGADKTFPRFASIIYCNTQYLINMWSKYIEFRIATTVLDTTCGPNDAKIERSMCVELPHTSPRMLLSNLAGCFVRSQSTSII